MSQVAGVILVGLGAWLLWSPWALLIAGMILLVAPEVGAAWRLRRVTGDSDRDASRAPRA